MERRFAVHARAYGQALIVALGFASGTASAAPKAGEARAQFDKGVAAYTKGDYAAAAEALGASFVLEADPETLFAWAQTERKLGHCDRAIDLYAKLLGMNLPAENKQAVQIQIDECKAIVGDQKPAAPAPALAPAAPPSPPAEPSHHDVDERAWWKDPVGGALVGAGAVTLGIGIVFLVQGASADSDKDHATSYRDYKAFADRAESRGRLGVIGIVLGAGLVGTGVAWYATHKPAERSVTAFVIPSGGVLAVSGRF